MENIKLVNLEQPLMIAEISCNHMGRRDILDATVNEAFQAGADLVKLQSSEPDCLTRNFNGPEFTVIANGSPWNGMNLYHLYERTCTPINWPLEIIKSQREIGRTVFSTPFSIRMVDLLEDSVSPLLYKVSSIDWNYLDLIRRCLSTSKPVLVSLVKPTIQLPILNANGCGGIIPMYCVSRYPAYPKDFNMYELEYLAKERPRAFGFSDHSLTPSLSSLAVAHGATVIERHFKLNADIKSDDAHFSADPKEFSDLVHICKEIGTSYSSHSDLTTIAVGRSIYIDRDVEPGSKITRNDVCIIRPGGGLDPVKLDSIIGRRAKFKLAKGMRLELSHLEN